MDVRTEGFREAVALFRRGDFAAARRESEAALPDDPDNPALLQLLGIACCRSGDARAGADYLGRSLAIAPDQLATRLTLATALIELGSLEGAEAVCAADAPGSQPGDPLWRLRAYILQQQGRFAEASEAYRRVVEREPKDFESWNNLGNAQRDGGDLEEAIASLVEAARLAPDLPVLHVNLAATLAAADRLEESLASVREAVRLAPQIPAFLLELGRAFTRLGRHEEALGALDEAARVGADDPQIHFELGLTHASLGQAEGAEAAYRRALEIAPGLAPAFLNLAILLEGGNRPDDCWALLAEAPSRGIGEEEIAFPRALLLRRDGELPEALALARAAPPTVDPVRRAQLIGEIADRLGDSDAAFASFAEMNRLLAEHPSDPRRGAAEYRRQLQEIAALTTRQWYAGWSSAEPNTERPAPVFLVGFPRSGTTLLDTVLMGHPDTHVIEERPMLWRVSEKLGDPARLAELSKAEVDDLRALYFAELDALAPEAAGKTIVDKFPLHIVRTALIQRIFPDARFIFAERHPCDAVLSCFIANFRLNYAMANFLNLSDAAALYDLILGYWHQCRNVFPLRVHNVRYETMVQDLEGTVRPLLDFLGLPWDEAVLDHQRTASARGYISTPSYAQVREPIYDRACGRWRRYREQMRDVLPVLEPWCERLGYEP